MMSFPLRLRADLLRARLQRRIRGQAARPLIFRLNPASDSRLSAEASAPVKSETDLFSAVQSSAAPIVWIGGSEPLDQPAIGTLARRITDAGRTVFVETNGVLLRRRIHEFRPVSRLFVTVKFHGLEQSHDLHSGHSGAFRAAVEGIRTAKLSGFLICAHALIDADSLIKDIVQLKEYLAALDADGFLISAAPLPANSTDRDAEILRKKVSDARNLITSPGWQRFSRALDLQAPPTPLSSPLSRPAPQAASIQPQPPVKQSDQRHESVRVS
jgi:hypothetical protein